jgi:anti-anti-sigma regulatory factor
MTLGKDDDRRVLTVAGVLDIGSANLLREALLECLLHSGEVTADLSEADGCDAAALQVLIAGRITAEASGRQFAVVSVSHGAEESAAALGIALRDFGAQQGEVEHDAA